MKRIFLNTIFFYKFVLFSICSFISLSPCYGINFKLGLEFQESSNLCPWALKTPHIQKKELFALTDGKQEKKLWHVVIDTNDIEYVTVPFPYNDIASLEKCSHTIIHSLNLLEKLFIKNPSITFQEWTKNIEYQLNEVKGHFFKLSYEKNNFDLIKDRLITRPSSDWKPKFSPQVTIQHALEDTIPLYFALFGFKEPSYMMPFVASLPFRDFLLPCYAEADSQTLKNLIEGYKQKTSGLVFLHALTLVQMTPPDENYDDSQFLAETLHTLTEYQQVDAKMKLTLMSRRPFSSMFKDLNLTTKYSEFFHTAMMNNNARFVNFFKVPELFYKANYAEQFFDDTTGLERSLLHLLPLFQEEFIHKNNTILSDLLQKGVISIAMLRNLKPEERYKDFLMSFNSKNYFETVLNSVESPKERYIIDLEKAEISKIPFNYDDLSPPWFSDFDNSMGAFKGKPQEEQYGEAIVEVRAIRNVGNWFLKKAALNPEIQGSFLTTSESLVKETLALFSFLKSFGTAQDMEDFTLGLTHAVSKN